MRGLNTEWRRRSNACRMTPSIRIRIYAGDVLGIRG